MGSLGRIVTSDNGDKIIYVDNAWEMYVVKWRHAQTLEAITRYDILTKNMHDVILYITTIVDVELDSRAFYSGPIRVDIPKNSPDGVRAINFFKDGLKWATFEGLKEVSVFINFAQKSEISENLERQTLDTMASLLDSIVREIPKSFPPHVEAIIIDRIPLIDFKYIGKRLRKLFKRH